MTKIYSVNLSFDPPLTKEITKDNHDYVHMTMESSSLESLKWMIDVIESSVDKEIRGAHFLTYPVEAREDEFEQNV